MKGRAQPIDRSGRSRPPDRSAAAVTRPPGSATSSEAEILSLQAKAGNAAVVGVVPELEARRKGTRKGVTSPAGKAGSMRIELDGDVHDVGIDEFAFGGSVGRRDGDDQATAKPSLENVRVGRTSDDLSPLLMHALSVNLPLESLQIDVVEPAKAGQAARTFSYQFAGAHVVDVAERGGAGAGNESLAFASTGMSMTAPSEDPEEARTKAAGAGGSAGDMKITGLRELDVGFGLHSFSWRVAGQTDAGSGAASGRSKVHEVVVTKDMDESSPALLLAMSQNKALKTARLDLSGSAAGAGGPAAAITSMVLDDVRVDSVQQAGGAGALETLAFSFEEFEFASDPAPASKGSDGKKVDAPAQLRVDASKSGRWEVPVLEWDWGVSTPMDATTGLASGRRQMKEFRIVIPNGPATVHALGALRNNELLKGVLLSPKSGPGYALATARVTDFAVTSGPEGQTTTVRFAYRSIAQQAREIEHQDQWSEDGAAASPGVAKAGKSTPGPGKAGNLRVELGGQMHVLPIESFALAASQKRDAPTGQAASKRTLGDVELTRHADEISPLLFQAISTNRNLKTVVAEVTQPPTANESAKTFTYTFGSARLTSLVESGGAGPSIERLALTYDDVTFQAPGLAAGEEERSTSGGPDAAGQMQLVGIDGGSADFAVSAVEWGASSPNDASSAAAIGKVRMKQVTITKPLDRLSPRLRGALATNATITSGTVSVRGGSNAFRGLRVDSIEQTSEGQPVERVKFSYEDYEMSAASESKEVADAKASEAPAKLVAEFAKQGELTAPILRWDWGSSSPTDVSTGQTSGRRRMRDFTIVVPVGQAAVFFLGAIANNEPITSATLTPKTGVAYALGRARVVDFHEASDGGASTVTVKLAYQEVSASSGKNEFNDQTMAMY